MKKLLTLALAFMGLATAANAAGVDDIVVTKHSYIVKMSEVCNTTSSDKGAKPGKGVLFGDGHILDVTGGSVANNKKNVDLSNAEVVGEDIANRWGTYYADPVGLNCFRLKNAQDVIAVKVTAGSRIIVTGEAHSSRYAKFAKDAKMTDVLPGTGAAGNNVATYTAADDELVYIGSEGGDYYVSYLIIEANEAEGTPMVSVGAQTYEDGLWYIDVTATPQMGMGMETGLTYTTDGTDPLTSGTKKVYDGKPIRCYQNTVVKFQAWMAGMEGETDCEMPGADNEAYATFKFNAPTVKVDGGHVEIESEYLAQGGKNVYSYGDVVDEGSEFTLSQSATVVAWTEIENGEYETFKSPTTTVDVYVLNAITEAKTIKIASGEAVVDAEATANATDGQTVYTVENGSITADPMDFFVKSVDFGTVLDREKDKFAKYQVPEGQEVYIKMSENTNISFKITEPVKVKVVCSKNSCKTLNPADDENVTTDRKIYVNVSGTTYGNDDITNGDVANLDGYQNVIEFELPAKVDIKDEEGNVTGQEWQDVSAGKIYTFQKYSGTGNILVSSIEIVPLSQAGSEANGDVNGDGIVNITDLNIIIDAMSGETVSGNTDVNGDGIVNITDLNMVIDIMSGEE